LASNGLRGIFVIVAPVPCASKFCFLLSRKNEDHNTKSADFHVVEKKYYRQEIIYKFTRGHNLLALVAAIFLPKLDDLSSQKLAI
jgi:hypothetical protein